jgi:hypothetical protein
LHLAGEAKLLHHKLENNDETRQLTLESYEEPEVGKKVFNDIDNSGDNDPILSWSKVLSTAIKMHVEEEEGDLHQESP